VKDKDEIGTISCSYDLFDDKNLHITISDDGAGIDIDKIKQKLQKQNIDTQNYSVEQLYSFIFKDSFSTKEDVSDLSGRGVGMSAVKYELDQLNGKVNITSQKDIGTTLEFVIPYK
jgi:two-component system chemotaxis sensor kinase CheA